MFFGMHVLKGRTGRREQPGEAVRRRCFLVQSWENSLQFETLWMNRGGEEFSKRSEYIWTVCGMWSV